MKDKPKTKIHRVYEHLGNIVLTDGVSYRFLNRETHTSLSRHNTVETMWEIAITPQELAVLSQLHEQLPNPTEFI